MDEHIDLICSLDEVGLLEKGGNADHWCMYGWASTPTKDADEENVIQKGLNLDPLMQGGYVNWDHQRHQIIGWPTVAELRSHPDTKDTGVYIEYELLKGMPMAQHVYKLAKELKKSKAPRQLGLSIEGRKRAVSTTGMVLKADVLGVAVTPYPKNTDTTTDILMKGILSGEQEDPDFRPLDVVKAVTTGHSVGGPGEQTGGAAMRQEYGMGQGVAKMDPGSLIEAYKCLSPKLQKAYDAMYAECQKRKEQKLTKGEAALVAILFGYPIEDCLEYFGL